LSLYNRLNLGGNEMGAEGAVHMAAVLARGGDVVPQLRKFSLRSNLLEDRGTCAIAGALQASSGSAAALEVLNLSFNSIGGEGVNAWWQPCLLGRVPISGRIGWYGY